MDNVAITSKDVSSTKEKTMILLGHYERYLKDKTSPMKISRLQECTLFEKPLFRMRMLGHRDSPGHTNQSELSSKFSQIQPRKHTKTSTAGFKGIRHPDLV